MQKSAALIQQLEEQLKQQQSGPPALPPNSENLVRHHVDITSFQVQWEQVAAVIDSEMATMRFSGQQADRSCRAQLVKARMIKAENLRMTQTLKHDLGALVNSSRHPSQALNRSDSESLSDSHVCLQG